MWICIAGYARPKVLEKRNVLSWRLKLPSSLCSRSVLDSEFQTVGPVTEKALRPNVLHLKRGTSISCLLADRRCCLPATSARDVKHSLRYCGAEPYRQRCTITESLYSMHWGTSSQWSFSCSSCDRPRSNFRVSLTTRAAAFMTRCNLSVVTFGVPASTALQ